MSQSADQTAPAHGIQARDRATRLQWIRRGATASLLLVMLTALVAQGPPPAAMAISVVKVKNACFANTVVVMGNIVPRNEVQVRPDREGLQIKEVLVEAGSTVAKSAPLARLNAPNDPTIVTVNAPVGGLVLAAPTIGDRASARGDPLFRIAEEGKLDLAADVPAKQAALIEKGQKATIKVAGLDDSSGSVGTVPLSFDASTQMGQMRIELAYNPLLRVGAFGRATLNLGQRGQRCGASIPLSALLFGPEGPVVQTVRNDRIETRRVDYGLIGGGNVEIRQGLFEGDVIVLRAGAFLRDGYRVRPVATAE
jgi:HlyD family secretion protein